jgi:integrase/recombinase XerD
MIAATTDSGKQAEIATENEMLIDRFVKLHRADDVKEETAEKYRGMLRELAAYYPNRRLTELDADELRLFLLYLKEERPKLDPNGNPRSDCEPGLAASTRKAYLGAYRLFYRHLRKRKLVEDDPTEDLKTPKVVVKQGFTIGEAELRMLLIARGNERDTIQAHLLAYTLARVDSVAGIRWSDVRFDDEEIWLDRAKGDQAYMVPLHPELKKALLWWKLAQMREAEQNPKIAAALDEPESAYVLLTETGRPVRKQTIAKQIDWRAARAGIARFKVAHGEKKTRVTPHVIRRSMATYLRQQGQDVFDVQALLNHSDPATTLKHYCFAGDKAKKRAVAAIAI